MRKIALLTIPLLLVGLFSLSADPMMGDDGITATVSGDATLTWGIDLGTNATGFRNDMSANFEVTIFPEQSADTGMMDTDDLYAYIKLSDFKWVADKDGSKTSPPGIEAKLILGAFSIKTFSGPTVEVDYVDPTDGADDDGIDKEDEYPGPDADDVETGYPGAGLTLGYDLAPVTLSLGVVSRNDWKDDKEAAAKHTACHVHEMDTDKVKDCPAVPKDDQNVANAYAFLGTVGVDIGDSAHMDFAVAYAHEYEEGDDIGIGAKATFDLGDIDPYVAFDAQIPSGDAGIPWDVGAGVAWNLSADEESSFATHLIMYAPADKESTIGVAVSLTEGEADTGALAGLGAVLTVGLDNLSGDESTWTTIVDAHYAVEGIKPFFRVSFSSAEDAKTAFKAGLELKVIEHLTTTLQYASKDITGDADKGEVTAALKIAY